MPAVINKLKTFFIISSCFFYYLIRGTARQKINHLGKILIIQLAKIGDMVCTTPLFRAVKAQWPNIQVYVISNKVNQELLANHPDVDNYLVFDRHFFKLLKKLKKEKIDFGCLASPNFIGLALMYLAGIPLIVAPQIKNGFCPYETKSYRILRKLVVSVPHLMGSYAPAQYLKLLEPLELFSQDTEKHLTFSQSATNWTNDFFKQNSINYNDDFIIGIAPSAGNKIKLWQSLKFAKLTDYLYQKYQARIVILGSIGDKPVVDEMISLLSPETKYINTCPLLNLDQLKALIARLNLLISVDSGPIYLAEAFKVPTVDIVGPINELEQPPIGRFHKVVKLPSRIKPELSVMNARIYNQEEARRQIGGITLEAVIKITDDLIADLR